MGIYTIKKNVLLFIIVSLSFSNCRQEIKLIEHNKDIYISSGDRLYSIGDSLFYKGKFKNALLYYGEAVKAFKQSLDTVGLAKSLNDVGLCYYKRGFMDSARVYYNKAIKLDSIQQDTIRIIGRLRNIGLTYYSEGDYLKSITYYKNSLQLAIEAKKSSSIAAIHNALGSIYQNQGRYNLSKKHFTKSLNLYLESNKPQKIALAYNNLGIVEGELGNFEKALKMHYSALDIKRDLGNRGDIAFSFHNVGVLSRYKKAYDISENYLKKAYNIRKELGEIRNLAITSNAIAGLYLDKKQANLALPYLESVQSFCETHKNQKIHRDNLRKWAEYYSLKSQYKSAYKTLENWTKLNDSVFNAQKLDVLQTWNQFELQQKEDATLLQKQRADKNEETANNRLQLVLYLIGFIILVFIFLTVLIIQRKKILKLNAYLDLLNVDIRHRKHNDYQRIINELNNLGLKSINSFENILFASLALDDTLYYKTNSLVDLKVHLSKVLKEKQKLLNMKENGVMLRHSFIQKKVSGDIASKLAFILSELITNSIKHAVTQEKALELDIKLRSKNNKLLFIYTDNGKEVSKDKLELSNGLGWKIICGFVKQLNSSIDILRDKNLNIFKIVINLKPLKTGD